MRFAETNRRFAHMIDGLSEANNELASKFYTGTKNIVKIWVFNSHKDSFRVSRLAFLESSTNPDFNTPLEGLFMLLSATDREHQVVIM
jgi:hypothetical protein